MIYFQLLYLRLSTSSLDTFTNHIAHNISY